ncbi:hypothetical protein LXL04_023078 [Taraxacum kok-saghyz]
MAEIVLSAFLTVVFEKMASEPLKRIARSKGIDSELKKLKRSLDQIQTCHQALFNDACRKEVTNEAVGRWLNGLQHLAYDIDDLLDDLANEVIHRDLSEEGGASTSMVRKLIPSCCTNFSQNTRMQAKLDDIATKLHELVEAKNNIGLSVITYEKPKIVRYEASLVDAGGIVGRESDKKKLLQKLLGDTDESSSQNFSIVPIVGMGGVGKTTLARLLYDQKEVQDHFELRAWVCVSDEFNISNISKVIYQSVTGENKEFADLNLLQESLKMKLQSKLFLIVLDDVWSESYGDWEKLVCPFFTGCRGSRVIMTTRKEQLIRKLGFSHQDPLQGLSQDHALSLFAQHAMGVNNFDSHPTFRTHGEVFVKKCGGLPLALRTLGRLLRTKENEEEWKELLDSEIWKLGNNDEIIPALRLSYYDLSASLKLLFAYCSLFPKDYKFDKEDLILLWMAEGFLDKSTTSTSMRRLGHEYFQELLSRSFFQHAPNDKSLFVMHDLMNDLATSIAGDFFVRLDIEKNMEFRKEALEKHRHMSFVCDDYMLYEKFKPFKGAKSLRTLLALSIGVVEMWDIFYISNKVLNGLLHEFPLLRVLRLSDLTISEVPGFVGSLKHLRYLNLSRTKITYLPENVCNLYNLQTLVVFGCENLIKLPESFSKLKNLQHFDMRGTWKLKKMPLGIGGLKSLHTLSNFGSSSGLEITELKNLKNLHGKVSIRGLGNLENATTVREANLSQNRFSELQLHWGDEFNALQTKANEREVLNELKPHNDNLEKLTIASYRGIEFPDWVGDLSLLWLTEMFLYDCPECVYLPRLGQLPSLKELVIGKMSRVKVVGWEFLGSGLAFPSLKILHFDGMSGWEEWSTTNSGVVDGVFPCLEELFIEDCPNLIKVFLKSLPSLRVLQLKNCRHGVLKSLVDVASSVSKLDIYDISGLNDEQWRGVMEYLGDVVEVTIRSCNEIRYLWESDTKASKFLINLRRLDLYKCSNLVRLGKKEDNCGSNLTSLRFLRIWKCNNLEHCSCPNNIESLRIEGCASVTSVSFPGGGQNLASFTIWGCKKLLETELVGREKTGVLINSNMHILNKIVINNQPYLKSINELSCFIHLKTLMISDCQSLESFPDHELPNLTSLTHMLIENCQSMDASFSHGLWPPKLIDLQIGGLKKPISEWSPHDFPSSLVNLRLHGGPSEDVSDFSQLSHILPSSLSILSIDGFEKLESISTGLRHLTSLQRLFITNCPKTIDLPEKLLSSLLVLSIYGSPNLIQKSSKGGSYWPHVSLIPCFNIDW